MKSNPQFIEDLDGDDGEYPRRQKPAPGAMIRALIASTAEPLPTPLVEQIVIVRREILLRERCYAKWIEAGKFSEREACRELTGMRNVLRSLLMLAGCE